MQSKKLNKTAVLFYGIVAVVFVYVFAANRLTPYLSDDLYYLTAMRECHSLKDIWNHNIWEYMNHCCRFFNLLVYKILLYSGNKIYEDLLQAISFVATGILMYINVPKKRKNDVYVILSIYVLMFLFVAAFGQTVLWPCGTALYLFGIVEILGLVTLYRHCLNKDQVKHPIVLAIIMLLLGVIAGIANENTSGGAVLLLMVFTLDKLITNSKKHISIRNTIKPYMLTAHIGTVLGLALLVFGQGSQNRKDGLSEGHFTGFAGLLSHIYKTSVTMKELFAPLLIMILVALVILCVQHYFKGFLDIIKDTGCIYLFVGMAVCYVMAILDGAQPRVYFGGSIFFIIALVSFIQNIRYSEEIYTVLRYSLVAVLCLVAAYNCCINLINLFRINREENERIAWISEAVHNGEDEVIVPNYRPQFDTDYSAAYENDMTTDSDYWINVFYEDYYGIDRIIAIPRAEFNEMYGLEDE